MILTASLMDEYRIELSAELMLSFTLAPSGDEGLTISLYLFAMLFLGITPNVLIWMCLDQGE